MGLLNGLLELPWWGVVLYALGVTHITIAAVTIYLHRHQAHRALDLHPVISHFFRFWLWISTGMVTREWVSIHRKHHAKCETEDDPHSPQTRGIKKVFWEGAELYRVEAKNEETLDKYSMGCPNDWVEHNVYSKYSAKGMLIMLAVNLLLLGPIGLTVWAVQMAWIPVTAAGIINGIGHYWGYRNFDSPDAATNISPWGIIIRGEELHNNHHAFPTSAKLSSKAWEFDIGWMYIQILSAIGLAKVKRVAPTPVKETAKAAVDMATLQSVIKNRLHVLADYGRNVALPVLDSYKASGGSKDVQKRFKALLVNHSVIDDKEKSLLESDIKQNQVLETVYEYREQLKELWSRSTANQEGLLSALQEWCARAEKTGIDALEEFARSLKHYTVAAKTA